MLSLHITDDINQKNLKIRNPGVDIVRLVGMYTVIVNHFIFFGNAYQKYTRYQKQLLSLHMLSDWANNGFALLSGIVGYKTNRYSNLLYLWLTVFFYSFGIHFFLKHFKKNTIIKTDIYKEFFPIIYKRYWYFTSYFGMYLYLPVINKGISCLNINEFRLVILSTLGIFVIWKDLKNPINDVFNMNNGNSMIWILTYYLTGAYIGKNRYKYSGIKKCIFYILCIFIYIFPSYLYIKFIINQQYIASNIFQKIFINILSKISINRFDSFLKVSQSAIVCLFFLQINYNKYISKIVCYLGPLAFGIYLIHIHPIFLDNYLKHIFDDVPKEISLYSLILILLFKSLKTFIYCITIDYIRNKMFSLFRIRILCKFLESKLNKLLY